MRRLGAFGLAVSFSVTGGVGAPTPPIVKLLSVERLSSRYDRGVARMKGGWVLSGSSVIARTGERFHEQTVNRSPIPERLRRKGYTRIGDIDVAASYIYAPLESGDRGLGREVIARYDLKTLRFVDSVELSQHESPFVAIDSLRGIAYATDPLHSKSLFRYDIVRHWKQLAPLVLSTAITNARGGAVAAGYVWISTSDKAGDLYRVDERNGQVERLGPAGKGAVQGIDATTLHDAQIHVTTVDRRRRRVVLRNFKVG